MEGAKNLKHYIEKSFVVLDLDANTKDEAISELLIKSEKEGLRINVTSVMQDIYKKEVIVTSGLGYGVAFPHTPTNEVSDETIIFGVSKKGVDYSSLDRKPVHLFIMFLTPVSSSQQYLSHLSVFTKVSKLSMYVVLLIESKTETEFKRTMIELIENISLKG